MREMSKITSGFSNAHVKSDGYRAAGSRRITVNAGSADEYAFTVRGRERNPNDGGAEVLTRRPGPVMRRQSAGIPDSNKKHGCWKHEHCDAKRAAIVNLTNAVAKNHGKATPATVLRKRG